jgi:uncharacterized protein YodC (DUF2158 family)
MVKVGEIVIKNTGGNKMRVISIDNDIAECVWLTESFNQDNFSINDLVPISQYANIFKEEKRNDKIQSILGSYKS